MELYKQTKGGGKKNNSYNLTEYGEIERVWNLDRLQKRETIVILERERGQSS